ncbi:hypothetical protein ACU5AX_15570 [Sphingomonas sp. XXL09]|uniref:hypothetical protein n=1 Tax=Sphingomonas sp. XXL09 TaxID=3457787 RepID=UPI00406BB511
MLTLTLLMLAQAGSPATSAAQVKSPGATAKPSDDIVVTGVTDIDDPKSMVTQRTLGSMRTGKGAPSSGAVFAIAERFTHCAMRAGRDDYGDLRAALDGVINSTRQSFGQSQYIQKHATCAQDSFGALHFGRASNSFFYDTSYYDRGAMFLRAIAVFAPGLTLTTAQTADADVQARFNLRENELAKFRLPADRRYFEMAVCQVRLQPVLALQLIRSGAYKEIRRLEANIVNATPICTSNAKHVYFDGFQFRFYIADAVYRWAVAAKGVDSLIPKS